jgi:hypothetical protein
MFSEFHVYAEGGAPEIVHVDFDNPTGCAPFTVAEVMCE